MKKFSTNIKYLILSLALIIGSFAIASTASADTYVYNCNATNGGGTVTSEVNLTPGTAPYVFGPNATFNATGQITTSNCTVNQVRLTARNNFGADENLILATAIGSNDTVPFIPAVKIFTTPANACSSPFPGICPFRVYFVTGVNETLPAPPRFAYIHASNEPVMGGTSNTNIVCTAGVENAINLTEPAEIYIKYEYYYPGNNTGSTSAQYCAVTVVPMIAPYFGTGSGTDWPGRETGEIDLQTTCWESSSIPVDPSIPQC